MAKKAKKFIKSFFKGFTLIELIIVVAIVAVLAVSGFLVLTKWIGKARDSKRISDVNVMKKALDVGVLKKETNMYPIPDEPNEIYAFSETTGALAAIQGVFGDGVRQFAGDTIQKVPTDPASKGYYEYSVTNDRSQYQLVAKLDSQDEFSFLNEKVYANESDNLAGIIGIEGNFIGGLITNTGDLYFIWNLPSLFLLTGNLLTTGSNEVRLYQEGKPVSEAVQLSSEDVEDVGVLFVATCDAACETKRAQVYTKIQQMFKLEESRIVTFVTKEVPGLQPGVGASVSLNPSGGTGGTGDTGGSTDPNCGNGVMDEGEECDFGGISPTPSGCTAQCKADVSNVPSSLPVCIMGRTVIGKCKIGSSN